MIESGQGRPTINARPGCARQSGTARRDALLAGQISRHSPAQRRAFFVTGPGHRRLFCVYCVANLRPQDFDDRFRGKVNYHQISPHAAKRPVAVLLPGLDLINRKVQGSCKILLRQCSLPRIARTSISGGHMKRCSLQLATGKRKRFVQPLRNLIESFLLITSPSYPR